jgi:pimeloyl-ACP methyl ester carboxylesterase
MSYLSPITSARIPRQTGMALTRGFLVLLCAISAVAQDGTRVDLGTHKLNIICTGAPGARPVVLLEAGGGGTSAAWKAVQAALPATIRACAYDRAGSGKSDPGPQPRTMDAEAADLHLLLEKSGITEPIVFVGQSIGGILARLYLHKYPDLVAGMLLVDPTDEDSVVFNTRVNRWIKVRELEDSLGEGARTVAKDRQSNPVPLGNRPLIVIGAGKREQPPGTSAEQWTAMRSERDARVKELSNLSRNSKFVLDPDSGHNVERDDPKLVAKAIQDLVNELSASRRLPAVGAEPRRGR